MCPAVEHGVVGHQDVAVEQWRIEYNTFRPHSALGGLTPPSTPPAGPTTTTRSTRSSWTRFRGPLSTAHGAAAVLFSTEPQREVVDYLLGPWDWRFEPFAAAIADRRIPEKLRGIGVRWLEVPHSRVRVLSCRAGGPPPESGATVRAAGGCAWPAPTPRRCAVRSLLGNPGDLASQT